MSKIPYSTRKKVFIRDNFTCKYCNRKADNIYEGKSPWSENGKVFFLTFKNDHRLFEVDHKKPRSKGGTDHIRNLLTACAECNLRKSDTDYKKFIEQTKL